MFGKSIRLFNLFGFQVKIDVSWFILVALIIWSLAVGLFPHYYKGLSSATYWWMAILGAIGLFVSIIAHEFMHSLVARNSGLPIRGITLFVFGGVAHMEQEPPSAKAEFLMATAGPAASVVIGSLFYGLRIIGASAGWSIPVIGTVAYLAFINWILAGFNLLPAFPLDGGRILRAVLWSWKKNIRWATRVSSRIGSFFGILMVIYGFLQFFSGNFIGGVWIFLVGMFLQGASRMSYRQLLTRQALEGEQVRRFMKQKPVTVPSSISLSELVEDYVYEHHFKMFPVVDDNELRGCITTQQLKEVPKQEWSTTKVKDIANSCTTENTISPDTDAVKALATMNRTGNSRLLVVEDNHLVGVLTLKDIMSFLSVKLDLMDYVQ
jgi:Zn-dependent protease/predicted transcriptional regulator